MTAWIAGFGMLAPALFVFTRAVGTVFFLGSSMAITVGVLLGLFWSAIYNFFASTIGAVLAFSVARYLVSDWVKMHLIVEGRSGGRLGKKYQGG